METREAILDFQYSEKMKSGLIIAAGLLGQLDSLDDRDRAGGVKVLTWYFEGLLREIHIGNNVLGLGHYSELERKVTEVIGRIQLSQFGEAQYSLSEAISLTTTLCQASLGFLIEKHLI